MSTAPILMQGNEAVAEATARQGSASLELLVREVSRLQAHARALEAALEGAGEAALAATKQEGVEP